MGADGWMALANVIMAVAAIFAAMAAWVGLRTWKAQISFQTDHKLATDILKLIFRHKDAVATVRHPAIWGAETEAAIEDKEEPDESDHEKKRFFETAAVYEKRWEKIVDVRSDLYPLLLEAEAIWGSGSRDLLSPLFELEMELRIIVQNFLRASNPSLSEGARSTAERSLSKKRDIMYDTLAEDDEFRKDYESAMTPIEDFLWKKLK